MVLLYELLTARMTCVGCDRSSASGSSRSAQREGESACRPKGACGETARSSPSSTGEGRSREWRHPPAPSQL